MDAEATVESYYERLRAGEPLSPYFLESPRTVKFGVGERLTGYEAIAEGLAEQTATTTGWVVDSARLCVGDEAGAGPPGTAWFSDDVHMAWTDHERSVEHAFDTRWSGTLVRLEDEDEADPHPDTAWRFAGMHVSTAVRPGER
jgi:hypothetical protein